MSIRYEQVTIVGVGLLGGSLGLALKSQGMAGRIVGVGHRQVSLDAALACGAIDEASLELAPACTNADLIVVCTPAANVTKSLDIIRGHAPATAIVTDVASTKAVICAHAEAAWPKPVRFVGSHPMAGSEKFGAENGTATLYAGSSVLVTPTESCDPEVVAAVRGLWSALGASVVDLAPEVHDRLVANTSHVPHIVASCLAELAARAGGVKAVVGNGFRDMTRIAAGRPEIWRDICTTNREAIAEGLMDLSALLNDVRAMVETNDAKALDAFFTHAHESRDKALGE